MLTIRTPQLDALRRGLLESFVPETASYLCAEYPRHFAQMGHAGMLAFVERGLGAARALRFESKGAIVALLELWLVYGERLERAPRREWAQNILSHPRLPEAVRIDAVRDRFEELTAGRVLVVHGPQP